MTVGDGVAAFIEELKQATAADDLDSTTRSLRLLTAYFSDAKADLQDLTPRRIRDFLARWYVEESASKPPVDPQSLIHALRAFLCWAEERAAGLLPQGSSAALAELEATLPRALEIMRSLRDIFAERGGPFSFPEFLTSFEEGGRSQYDLDATGEVGAIESYFRVVAVRGSQVEAEDLISEERVEPIIFPDAAARLLSPGYIINLEIVRAPDGWQITGCGLVYPPGAEV